MRDFVVYIKGPVGTNTVLPPAKQSSSTPRVFCKEGAAFKPHVLPIVAGTTVEMAEQ